MANEAIKVEGTGQTSNIRTFTVADGAAITKHTLMALVLDNTASACATAYAQAAQTYFAGINLAAKEASDGQTQLALDTGGVWDLTASNAILMGHKVILAGANKVMSADDGTAALTASGGVIVGTALETATAGEVIRVDLSKKG